MRFEQAEEIASLLVEILTSLPYYNVLFRKHGHFAGLFAWETNEELKGYALLLFDPW